MVSKAILIDARIIASSTGTYVRQLLNHLPGEPQIKYQALMSRDHFNLVDNANIELVDFGHTSYGIKDQIIDQVQLPRIIHRLRPDLVHYTLPFAPLLSHTPFVVTFHDFNRFDFPDPNKIKQLGFELQAKNSLRRAKHIITPSDYVKNDLLKRLVWMDESKITRTYESGNLTDASPHPIAEIEDQDFYLHVGNGQGHKNVKLLLETWDKHANEIKAKLVVVGRFKRQDLAAQSPLSDNVITPGWVSEPQKKWAYKNCRAFITASLSEGFGLPGVEAMTAGAPVLSSDSTCLPEVYGPGASYFDPNSTDSLLQAINTFDAVALRQAGSEHVKQFSWSDMAEQTAAVYQSTTR